MRREASGRSGRFMLISTERVFYAGLHGKPSVRTLGALAICVPLHGTARLEIEGALGEAVAKLRAARATEALLRREAMPQARAAFQTVLANYGQGRGDLTGAIAVEHQTHEVELRLLQAQLDEQVELAAIERLIGGDL